MVMNSLNGLLTAAAPAFDVTSVVESAATTASSQMFSVLTIVVPIVAGVAVAVVGVKFGMKWIKSLGK